MAKVQLTLGKWLKTKGVSQQELAESTGISSGHISRMVNGKTAGIQFEMIHRICEALDIQPSQLLGYVDEEDDEERFQAAS